MILSPPVTYPTGLSGVNPSIVYIETNNDVPEITTPGFLNHLVQQGFIFNESMMALVSTKDTPNAPTIQVGWYSVTKSGADWSLQGISSELNLPNSQIFIGNASNIATPRSMSGNATINNTGVLTISNNAITTVKIADANVTNAKLAANSVGTTNIIDANVTNAKLASNAVQNANLAAASVTLSKLATPIAPAGIIKFIGTAISLGGSATESFTVSGAASSDRAFTQALTQGPNTVTVLTASVDTNTLTLTFSADPGAGTIVHYQICRVTSE